MSRMSSRLARYDDDADTALASWSESLDAPQPTPVHEALVDMMDRMLGLARSAARDGGPAATGLAVALRTMHKLRPMALESLASVPTDDVRVFLRQLANELDAVVNAGEVTSDTRPALTAAPRAGLPAGGNPDGEEHPDGVPAD